MLQSISWQTYFTTAAVLLVFYYTLIWFVFYRNRLKPHQGKHQLFQQKSEGAPIENADLNDMLPQDHIFEHRPFVNESSISPAGQSFLDEMKALTAATGEDCNKSTLVNSLQNLLKKYPSLKHAANKKFIENIISGECKRNCSIDLSEEDIREVWAI